MMKKDLIISIAAHLVLAVIIVVINPISAMFRPKPEIIIVKTFEEMGSPAPKNTGPAKIAQPKSEQEADDVEPLKPKEKIIPEKPKKETKKKDTEKKKEIEKKNQQEEDIESETAADDDNKPKPDGKGGIDVNEKVGGSGTGVGKGTGDLPYNIGMVLRVIERNWRNVVTDANPITCTVYFQIDRYGYVVGSPMIEKSSGITTFDQDCVLAIRRAGQFPAFPANFNYAYLGLHLDFEYIPGR